MTPEKRERIRTRYLRDATPIRLGGLAANLARINSFSRHQGSRDVVESVIDESKHFIEWAGPELELEIAYELLALQRQLVHWQRDIAKIWSNDNDRLDLSTSANDWSEKVLKLSGLLAQNSRAS